jgi:DNA-binding response OmpR family regulator
MPATPAIVLVVDDDPDVLNMLAVVLLSANYTVLRACDGAEALAIAERERPDLILSDVNMPKLTGVELAARLRAREDGYGPPILLMSGVEPPALPDRTAFLPKPFLPDRLLQEAAALLPDASPPPNAAGIGGAEAFN